MEENPIPNPLAKKIALHAADRGDDFRIATIGHLKIIHKYHKTAIPNRTKNDSFEFVISQIFLKNMGMYPTTRFLCTVNENSAWPVPILPIDVFCAFPKEFRAERFKKLLKANDVLDCRIKDMTSVDNPYYHLSVLHKYNSTQVLDDLDIEVKLKKQGTNALLLGKKLTALDYLRVAVSCYSNDEILVSLSGKNVGDVKHIGKIFETDLPSYVRSRHAFEMFPTYSSYLKSFPQYGNPHALSDIYNGFGLDSKMAYSFTPKYNEKHADEETGQVVLKKIKKSDAQRILQLSVNKAKEKNFQDALKLINKAIESCPKDDELKYVMYRYRGDFYANFPENLKYAVSDWITSFTYNQNTEKQLSVMLSKISKRYCVKKQYQKAIFYAENALKLHPDNAKATKIIEYVKKKQPEVFPHCDDQTLQQRKREIVSELQKVDKEKAEIWRKRKHSKKGRR